MEIDRELIRASAMPNGTVTFTVTAFDDAIVELEEIFTVVGQVAATGLVADGTGREFPVVFNSPVICTIPVDDGKRRHKHKACQVVMDYNVLMSHLVIHHDHAKATCLSLPTPAATILTRFQHQVIFDSLKKLRRLCFYAHAHVPAIFFIILV